MFSKVDILKTGLLILEEWHCKETGTKRIVDGVTYITIKASALIKFAKHISNVAKDSNKRFIFQLFSLHFFS